MKKTRHSVSHSQRSPDLSRRAVLQGAAAAAISLALPAKVLAGLIQQGKIVAPDKRFPYFQSTPVSYFNVRLHDSFWAPRQRTVHAVSVPWATRHFDAAGGVDAYKAHPNEYVAKVAKDDLLAVSFLHSMAAVVG